jgi:hypothetical protein
LDNLTALTPDDLGTLVWCAMDFDRKLPGAAVPPRIWEALTPEWQGKINRWRGADRDQLGAEVRKP